MIAGRMLRRLSQGALLLASSVLGASSNAEAQSLPSSNGIRIVAPAPPGTPPDVSSRIMATELAESEGWRVVVENKPGAGGALAATSVLLQPADGTTILMITQPDTVTPALMGKMPFRLDTDFAPLIKVSVGYNVLVVHPSVPARSVSELVALLKSQPDKFNFSSGGFGTPAHLLGELFKLRTGVRATHVPYQGQQRMADFLSGATHFSFYNTAAVVDLIATGKLRALAVTAPQRIAVLKDLPTMAEQGFPALVVEGWDGFAVKNGTSNDIVARMNESMNKVLTRHKIRVAFANGGSEPAGGTPAEFGDLIRSEIARWGEVVKDSGIRMPQ